MNIVLLNTVRVTPTQYCDAVAITLTTEMVTKWLMGSSMHSVDVPDEGVIDVGWHKISLHYSEQCAI